MPRSLEASDKQRLLAASSGFASDTAAIALNAKKTPFDAIQLLELGREVIAGSLNEIRADTSELQQKYPQLLEEYLNFQNQPDTLKTFVQSRNDERYTAGQKLEQKVQEIRALPGFDRFYFLPLEKGLKKAAAHGPIIIINISEWRYDALVVEHDRLQSLELLRLFLGDIRDRIQEDLTAPIALAWLWETIACPVLNTLRFT